MRTRTLIPDWLGLVVQYYIRNEANSHVDSVTFDWQIHRYPGANWVSISYELREWDNNG